MPADLIAATIAELRDLALSSACPVERERASLVAAILACETGAVTADAVARLAELDRLQAAED